MVEQKIAATCALFIWPLCACFKIPPCVSTRQILPKDTLEAVLVGLCGPAEDESAQTAGGWIGGPNGGSGGNGSNAAVGRRHDAAGSSSRCVWTELTAPVMTTALNLKPTLSDRAIAALVRGVEAAGERAALQVRGRRKAVSIGWDGVSC